MQTTKKKAKKPSSFYRRQDRWGLLMMTPWLIGILLFFLKPLVEICIYSLNDVKIENGLQMSWVGIQNFNYVLRVHSTFYQDLIKTFTQALPNTVLIIFFSLFAAVLLNGKFKFRGAARVLFFLPIVMATDLISIELTGVTLGETSGGNAASETLTGAMMLANFLVEGMGLPVKMISMIGSVIGNVFETIKLSGVQILIFLAGLQSVSPSMYEVAKMEGATAYETFWKVTLPTVSPLVLTNVIYTLTDNLMRTDLIDTIQDTAFAASQYGNSAAMSVSFLFLTLVVIGIVVILLRKVVFYND